MAIQKDMLLEEGFSEEEATLIYNDVVGQIKFYSRTKEYVKDQTAFHKHLGKHGLEGYATYNN